MSDRPHPAAALAFSSHRSLAPLMWVLVALSTIELCVVHLLVALLWSPRVALALSALSLATIGWIVAAIRSLRRLPVLVAPDHVVLRAGSLLGVTVGRDDVAGVRTSFGGEAVKRRATLNLALLAFPNVIVDLAAPVRVRRRMVDAVALKLDAPAGFVAALSADAARG